MNHMTREQMRGSWAGAMGNMQFMPSTFMKWGVDRTGDGRIDLWTSLPDAFASAANFLRGIGWKPPLPASEEVFLPQGFPLDQADTTVEKPVRAWAQMGVKKAGSAALPSSDEPSSIILPAGFRGPAFILYPNFKAVMNWNRSTLYALSVAILAQQIAGGAPVMQGPPADDEPLSRDTVIDMQNRLARLTLYTDEVDGLLGPKTRSAVRLYQKQVGMPADGHPTPEFVRRLQQADGRSCGPPVTALRRIEQSARHSRSRRRHAAGCRCLVHRPFRPGRAAVLPGADGALQCRLSRPEKRYPQSACSFGRASTRPACMSPRWLFASIRRSVGRTSAGSS